MLGTDFKQRGLLPWQFRNRPRSFPSVTTKTRRSNRLVYGALEEKGYNPVNQLVGYILSEDPTYITTYKNARALIRRIDRDDLLQALVRDYVRRN